MVTICLRQWNLLLFCNDKTGTLTLNLMIVVEVYICGKKIDPPNKTSELPSRLVSLLIELAVYFYLSSSCIFVQLREKTRRCYNQTETLYLKVQKSNEAYGRIFGFASSTILSQKMANANNVAANSFTLTSLCQKVTFDGTNFSEWIRYIRTIVRYEDKEYVLDEKLEKINPEVATPEEMVVFETHERDATQVHCIMIATMNQEFQKSYEDMYPYEMHQDLMERYHQSARQERYEIITNMITAKMGSEESLTMHLQKMQRYVDRLHKLNVNFGEDLAIDIVLHSLPSCYNQFRITYHMNKEEATLSKLQGLLRTAESNLKDKSVAPTPNPSTAHVLAIRQGRGKKRKAPSKSHHKGNSQDGSSSIGTKVDPAKPNPNLKEAECHHCHKIGHWKRSCPEYLQAIKEGKIKPSYAGIYTIKSNDSSHAISWALDMARNIISFHGIYSPSDNVVFVSRRGVFRERELISQGDSGRHIDIEEIQESSDEGTSTAGAQPEEETPVEPIDKSLPLRRSERVRVQPHFYGFHITTEGDTYISDGTLINIDEPNSYKEAMAGPESAKWKEAMDSEIQSMYDNQVWNLVDNVPGRKTVGCKWIFKKKTDVDRNVHTYKARLTFSPVAKIKSIRVMLAIAAFHDYEIWKMDVKTAFLNRKLARMFTWLGQRVLSIRNIPLECTSLKIKEFGFVRSEDESCVYVKASESIVSFLVLYVDDILLIRNDIPTLQEVKSWLGKCFAMKDLGEASYILGIRIVRERSKRLIGLSQNTYLDKVLKCFSMEKSKKGELPIQSNAKLSKTQSPSTKAEIAEMSRVPYASAVGSIMYVMTYSRLDVAFAFSMVSRYQGNPGKAHWIAVKNILKYLRRTKEWFLVLGGSDDLKVRGYSDASFRTDRDNYRSQLGWVFTLNGGAVTWKSSKQETVAYSTCESEYIAASEASKEAIWLKNFIGDLGVVPSIKEPMEIFCDNEGAVALTKEPRDDGRSRHIDIKYHFIRHRVEEGHLVVKRTSLEDNPADPITKELSKVKHLQHARSIGLKDDISLD
uniref:CCHC-type domain-containing protein n=1 Tax=Lactuca sativa TaxID=4236 RepID=A0A9R1VHU9_LACSA|nr:hypothetical protein LSAT_V11C500233370 [Lactuca sativa]